MIFGNPVKGTIYTEAKGTRWYVSQEFGCTGFRLEPPLGDCKHFNRGLDIARSNGACGDDALAVQAGTVIYSGGITTPGAAHPSLAVIVYHGNGHATGQSHYQSIAVQQGDKVAKGERIGRVGKTGLATGCHIDLVYKTGFPSGLVGVAGANAFYWDPNKGGKGTFSDIWPDFAQNQPAPKTVTLRDLDEIRIRNSATTSAKAYAETKAGRIIRLSDGKDIGPLGPHKYSGTVKGGAWKVTVDGKIIIGTDWVKLPLGGKTRYVAAGLAVVA